MLSFNGIPVILSEHMTESVEKHIYRNFLPGQRRGKDQRLRKLVFCEYAVVPMTDIMVINGMAVMHPDTWHKLAGSAEINRDMFADKLGIT